MKKYIFIFAGFLFASCAKNNGAFDAQGVFEAEEVMVSSELPGKLLAFEVNEGDSLMMNQSVGFIDSVGLLLQREQLRATLNSLNQKIFDPNPQIELFKKQYEVQSVQLKNLLFEKNRIQELLKSDAATRKQLDDLIFQIESLKKQMKVTQQQITVQQNNTSTQNRSILSESDPIKKRIEQVEDQLKKATVVNPISGVVLTSYAEAGEIVGAGKPLYKIANLSTIILRVYVTGDQLPKLKIAQAVKVSIDKDKDAYTVYNGNIWVDGLNAVADYKALRKKIGYMPGKFSLYTDLTIQENIHFFASLFETSFDKNYDLIKEIYEQIAPFKDRRAGQLSGGMKQKLALCCALIHRPSILFLDEPTTGVDAVSRKEFWEILQRLKTDGITILVSTPYMDEASLCDRVALIQNGKIMQIDTPQHIVDHFDKPLYAVKSPKMLPLLKMLENDAAVLDIYPFGEVHHMVLKSKDSKVNLPEDATMQVIKPNIEDLFIYLMRNHE